MLFQYENHAKSLELEESTLQKIKLRSHEKAMNKNGTWIDWQYLTDAADLLKKVHVILLLYGDVTDMGKDKELLF